MSGRKLLGWVCLLGPLVLAFVPLALEVGWLVVIVVALTGALLTTMAYGAHLIESSE